MKIKVFFDKNLNVLKVPSVLKIPHKRIVSNFIFDTGCPHTILNYTDSIRLGVPKIRKAELIRIGGRTYQSYVYNKIEILLKDTEGNLVTETLPVKILKPNSPRVKELEELDGFPNLLGMDFLKKGYKFFCDTIKDEVYFEKEA